MTAKTSHSSGLSWTKADSSLTCDLSSERPCPDTFPSSHLASSALTQLCPCEAYAVSSLTLSHRASDAMEGHTDLINRWIKL